MTNRDSDKPSAGTGGVTSDEVLLAFLERYAADRLLEHKPPLIEYLRLWPDHQTVVAREYLAAEAGRGAGGQAANSAKTPSGSERLGPYVIERELGRGGQGAVYLATDTRLNRSVALKVLHGLGPDAATHLRRFRREAEVASRLHHPGICGVHDTGVDGGVPYIAMPYVEGDTLADWIGRHKSESAGAAAQSFVDADLTTDPIGGHVAAPPTENGTVALARSELLDLLRIFEKTAVALHAAHEAGILHRDIKPGNIMVTKSGQPVILDFGLARLEDDQSDAPSLTRSGDLFGTPAYMSPEQIAGARIKLDRRSDVYSLGVTLYECLTLKRPFEGATREALYQAILTKSATDPRKLNRSLPKDLRVVIDSAIEKDRDRRYASAESLAHDLRAVLEGRPIRARPVGPMGRFIRWSKREPAKAALLGVILVAFPTIATLVTAHVKDRPQVEAARLAEIEQARDDLLSEAGFEVTEGDATKAVALYSEALDMEGGSPEAAGGLVLAQLKLKNPGEALHLLDRHRPLLGEGAAAHLLRAAALRTLGKDEEALALMKSAPPPRSAFEHHLLAQKELQDGEAGDQSAFRRALHHVTTAILLSPAPRLCLYTLRAHAAGHAKDREAALETVAGLRQRWAASASGQHWCGFALQGLEDRAVLDDVIAAYREAIRLKPDNAAVHSNLGYALREKGLLDDAIAACREAIRLQPHSDGAHTSLGAALTEKGLLDDAIASYREAIRLKPEGSSAWTNLGVALARKGLLVDAIAACREAVRLNPDSADARSNLGNALREKGLVDDAIAACREAIRLKPDSVLAHENLGCALRDKGLVDDAIAAFREAIRLEPHCASAHKDLGGALFEKGLVDDAIAAIREAIRLEPDDALAHHSHGIALANKGLLDDAIAAYRETIRLMPDIVTAHYGLGTALVRKGLLEDAVAAYREAIRLNPEYAEAHCNLGSVLRVLGQHRESLAEYRRGHELGSEQPGWNYPSERWVVEAEGHVADAAELEERLARHLAAQTEPESARDLVALARVALDQGHRALAARWFQSAFEDVPELADAIVEGHRRLAARAALLASMSGSDGALRLDDAARTSWRLQALAWLEDEIAGTKEAWDGDELEAPQVRISLVPLMRSPDYATVREMEGLAKLPEAERARWTKLWAEVEALLQALDRR